MLRLARDGDMRTRLTAMRDGQAAVRVAAVGAGLRTGILDATREASGTPAAIAARAGWTGEATVLGLLHVLASLGLVSERDGHWRTTRHGRLLLEDDVARAAYEGFSDFHTGLYDDLEHQLAGGPRRRDVAEKGDVIARLSRAMDPFVRDVLTREVGDRQPRRVLDVGCATGTHLAHAMRLLPEATGVGIEVDPAAAAMARRTLDEAGLGDRVDVVEGDVRESLGDVAEFDLALLANVVYYLPVDERVPLLRSVSDRVVPGGAVVVVTTALTDATFSRHFDLLLRTQEGAMSLPGLDQLCAQLREAGLVPGRPRRVAPGEPLTAVVATKP